MKSTSAWLVAAAVLLCAPAATAVPLTFIIEGGDIKVTASSGGGFLAPPVELPVDGRRITIDLDQPFAQPQTLVSLKVTSTGSDTVPLTPPIGDFDALSVSSLVLTGGPGDLFPLGPAGPDFEYFATIEDVVLDASLSLIDTTGPDIDEMLSIPLGTGTGTIFVSLSENRLSLSGVVTDTFVHPDFGPVSIKTDINVTAVVIPEPSAAVIFAIGLLPIARVVRRTRGADRSR